MDDLVEGIYRLLLSDYHEPVNIGNPTETSILEFAQVINRLTGNSEIRFEPKKRGRGRPAAAAARYLPRPT